MNKFRKKYQKLILNLMLFIIANVFFLEGYSQSNDHYLNAKNLGKLTYTDFQIHELEAFQNERIQELNNLSQTHALKAKAENNDIELARAFYYQSITAEPDIGLLYADSIIQITKESLHTNYPTIGYALKGHRYYSSGDFQAALNNYLIGYNLAVKKKNILQQREMSMAIAAIRNLKGQHHSAAEFYRRSLSLLEKENIFENYNFDDYLTLLYNLSTTHLRLQERDSAKFYVEKGIAQTFLLKDKRDLRDFVLLDAQINYYNNDYGKAKDTLLKYIDSLDGTSKAIKLYYLGKIEENSENDVLTINYFKKIDSILTFTGDPFNEIKDVYQQLIMHSIEDNDKRKQIEYIGKLIHYDSLLSISQENIVNKTMGSYDIPNLKYQKRIAEGQLKVKNKYIAFAGLMASMGALSGFYFFIRGRKMRKRLNYLIENGQAPIRVLAVKTLDHASSVPEDIRTEILNKLEIFENSDRFLNKEMDMSILAQELGTNTSYLSIVVNHYKEMSFPNYLKDIRITAAIERLSKDSQLLKYNNQGLAEIFGFKTSESFSKAFQSKTGVHPSKFVNELKARKIGRHL